MLRDGPNPIYAEIGGKTVNFGVSFYLLTGPFLFGNPDDYAIGKSKAFPGEGGPFRILVNVPVELIALTNPDGMFPLSQGLVQFDNGAGLEEFLTAWPSLSKKLIEIAYP